MQTMCAACEFLFEEVSTRDDSDGHNYAINDTGVGRNWFGSLVTNRRHQARLGRTEFKVYYLLVGVLREKENNDFTFVDGRSVPKANGRTNESTKPNQPTKPNDDDSFTAPFSPLELFLLGQ